MVGVDRLANYLESILLPLTTKKTKHYEYTNKKGNMEADSSAHRFNSHSYSNYARRYELHYVD